MYAVEYRRTMASARPKQPEPPIVLDLDEMRERRRLDDEKRRAEQRERVQQQKREAAEMIAKARQASERFRAQELAEYAEVTLRYRPTYSDIERRICRVMKVSPTEIRSNRRNRHLVLARQAVMYWCCRLTLRSLPELGRMIGGKDHTTILHGKRAYREKRAKMGRHLREVL